MLRGLLPALILCAGAAQGACRQSLILALDVSGSVDAGEYSLQLDGVAGALQDPAVRAALLDLPDAPVALAIFEWSGPDYQRLIQNWRLISSAQDIAAVAARLRGWRREPAPETTALGAAMLYARALQDRAPDCWRRVLDISGDGSNNAWPRPRDVRASGRLGDMTINALVIGAASAPADDTASAHLDALSAYFRAEILHGRDAFLETADGFEDYANALARKLLRELETLPMGATPHPDQGIRLASQVPNADEIRAH